MTVKLECIGCREIKDFPSFTEFPLCEKCKEWERKHLEEINSDQYLRQKFQTNEFKKKNIPDKLRWEVFERDNFTCQHCGTRKYLTVDHIFPESKGGEATIDNCQTLCRSCNSRKGAR